jgi:DNA-binding NtrC family response regulator
MLLDVWMPKMNGLDVLAAVPTEEARPGVVVMTSVGRGCIPYATEEQAAAAALYVIPRDSFNTSRSAGLNLGGRQGGHHWRSE